ncbi:hypothetical protein NXZ84_08155 [Mechercharimyces sp. CAU 1602]|nr:hypothetical protein [Mechercharimyces sp. CAU 1602]
MRGDKALITMPIPSSTLSSSWNSYFHTAWMISLLQPGLSHYGPYPFWLPTEEKPSHNPDTSPSYSKPKSSPILIRIRARSH